MGKHSGSQDANDIQGPHGPGPHPTEEESDKKGASFDAQFGASRLAAEVKRGGKK
jgi:hypothetical protein